MGASWLSSLSSDLSASIASVELQRSLLEELVLRLALEADALDHVSAALLSAAQVQASVLSKLQVGEQDSSGIKGAAGAFGGAAAVEGVATVAKAPSEAHRGVGTVAGDSGAVVQPGALSTLRVKEGGVLGATGLQGSTGLQGPTQAVGGVRMMVDAPTERPGGVRLGEEPRRKGGSAVGLAIERWEGNERGNGAQSSSDAAPAGLPTAAPTFVFNGDRAQHASFVSTPPPPPPPPTPAFTPLSHTPATAPGPPPPATPPLCAPFKPQACESKSADASPPLHFTPPLRAPIAPSPSRSGGDTALSPRGEPLRMPPSLLAQPQEVLLPPSPRAPQQQHPCAATTPLVQPPPLLAPSASVPVLFPPVKPARPVVIEPDMDDEGIEYVSNLKLDGRPLVGETLTASAEFVGRGEVFWSRVPAEGGEDVAIAGADGMTYVVTADDVECVLKVTASSVLGGDPVSVTTVRPVAPTSALAEDLTKAKRKVEKGEWSASVRGGGGESRVLVLTREKLKLRKKGIAGKELTLHKVELASGVPLLINPYDEHKLEIQIGDEPIELTCESRAQRDMLCLLIRTLARPIRKAADTQSACNGLDASRADEGDDSGYMDHQKRGFSNYEGEGEEAEDEAFKPKVKFKINATSEDNGGSQHMMRSQSLGGLAALPLPVAPPPSNGKRRTGGSFNVATTPPPPSLHTSTTRAADAQVSPPEHALLSTGSPCLRPMRGDAVLFGSPCLTLMGASACSPGAFRRQPPYAFGSAPFASGSLPARQASGAGPSALFQLQVVEVVSARFSGRSLSQFSASGEVRAVPLPGAAEAAAQAGATAAVGFGFALAHTDHVSNLTENPAHVRRDAAGALRVDLSVTSAAPVWLCRYTSAAGWAPIPLLVVPEWKVSRLPGAL